MKGKRSKKTKLNYKKIFTFIFLLAIAIFFIFKLTTTLLEPDNNQNEIGEQTQTPVEPDPITINMVATGDIMCHLTNVKNAYSSTTKDYDFTNVFKNIAKYTQNADITVGNLETTFAGKSRGYTGYPTFNTPEVLGKNLRDIGFDVIDVK